VNLCSYRHSSVQKNKIIFFILLSIYIGDIIVEIPKRQRFKMEFQHTIGLNKNFNKDTALLSYSFQMDGKAAYSAMGWNGKSFEKIQTIIGEDRFSNLISEKRVDISGVELGDIQEMWHKTRYKKYQDIYVPKDADMGVVAVMYDAYKARENVMIEREEGWGSYPSEEDEALGASVSDDGLVSVVRIGKSTGITPVLLEIAAPSSTGGGEFMFAGIKSVQIIGEPKVFAKVDGRKGQQPHP
jgi:hypothetical protein